jgi:hypothetical protein
MESRSAILLAVGAGSACLLVGLLLLRSESLAADEQGGGAQDALAEPAVAPEAATQDLPDLDRQDAPSLAGTREPIAPDPRRSTPSAFAPAETDEFVPEKPPAPRDLPESTREEMVRKREALVREINERSHPFFAERFNGNLAVRISDRCEYSGTPADPVEIFAVRLIPGEGSYRTALARQDFPELYALKDEVIRLEGLLCAR